MKKQLPIIFLLLTSIFLVNCGSDDSPSADEMNDDNIIDDEERLFEMGFSTWAYAPTVEAVEGTYDFIETYSDIYSEHIDASIPWSAWMNDEALPAEFVNEIEGRRSKKISGDKLTLSVSILNSGRDNLATDFDGTTPSYAALNDQAIEDAYFKHLSYITDQLNPDYLIMALEVNELLIHAPELWEGYKLLMGNIRTRIKAAYPTLMISESITLHNLYEPTVDEPDEFIEEIVTYVNAMDFATISFYPFFKGLDSPADFQDAFDFLHQVIDKPIAFSETSHLSEDLSVEGFDLFIPGNQGEQKEYLETLLTNAQEQAYIYIIWWAHRDYDELWETFPEEAKDLGQLWISTGILNEDGAEKQAYETWVEAFE